MGFTRARRYANHKGGRKYAKEKDASGKKVALPRGEEDAIKAESARIFSDVLARVKAVCPMPLTSADAAGREVSRDDGAASRARVGDA